MKRKNGDHKTIRWIIASAKGKKRYVALLVLNNSILAVLSVLAALLLAGIVDSAVAGDWDAFWFYSTIEITKLVFQTGLAIFHRILEEHTRASLENNLKRNLFSKLLTGDYSTVTATHSGEWMTRMTSDTVVVAGGMTSILPGIIGMIVRLVTSLGLMIAIAPMFSVISLVCGSVLVVFSWSLRKIMKQLRLWQSKPARLLFAAMWRIRRR